MKGRTDYLRLKWEAFASKRSICAIIILGFMVPVGLHISIIFCANRDSNAILAWRLFYRDKGLFSLYDSWEQTQKIGKASKF